MTGLNELNIQSYLQVEAAKSGLQASLLVRHPENSDLFVNFDPQILVMIRETECMARLGLEIPPVARTMRARQTEYKENYNALVVSTCNTRKPAIRVSYQI